MSLIYNGLPSINEATKLLTAVDLTRLLSELSQLLIHHRLNAYFGIVLVHRHFILSKNEQMVAVKDGENMVTSVFKNGLPDRQVFPQFNLSVPSVLTIVASSLAVRKSGLLAYEYKCTNDAGACAQREIMKSINSSFRAEWVDILERFEVDNGFGLIVLEDENIEFKREELYPKERVSVHRRIMGKQMEAEIMDIPTVWYSSGRGPVTVCQSCGHNDNEH